MFESSEDSFEFESIRMGMLLACRLSSDRPPVCRRFLWFSSGAGMANTTGCVVVRLRGVDGDSTSGCGITRVEVGTEQDGEAVVPSTGGVRTTGWDPSLGST